MITLKGGTFLNPLKIAHLNMGPSAETTVHFTAGHYFEVITGISFPVVGCVWTSDGDWFLKCDDVFTALYCTVDHSHVTGTQVDATDASNVDNNNNENWIFNPHTSSDVLAGVPNGGGSWSMDVFDFGTWPWPAGTVACNVSMFLTSGNAASVWNYTWNGSSLAYVSNSGDLFGPTGSGSHGVSISGTKLVFSGTIGPGNGGTAHGSMTWTKT